jgi:hypothetical protein
LALAGWGSVRVPAGSLELRLHDLTGFDGRCDAIVLTRDSQWLPPEGPALGAVVAELDSRHQGNAQPAANYDDEKSWRRCAAKRTSACF